MHTKSYMEVLDLENEDQARFDSRVVAAADRAARQVDFETIAMYEKAKLPLPARQARLAKQAVDRPDWDFSLTK